MATTVAYYKSCPLKKRPIVYEEEEIEVLALTKYSYCQKNVEEEQPQDLSLKRKASQDFEDYSLPAKREYVLDLTKNPRSSPIHQVQYRPESPLSYSSDQHIYPAMLSPPAEYNYSQHHENQPTNIHIRGLTPATTGYTTNPYQSAFVLAAGYNPTPALWTPYQNDVEDIYPSPATTIASAVSPHSVFSYQQMTPPSSPGSEASSEPEDLSLRNDIPLPALFHSSSNAAKKYRYKCEKCNKMYSTSMGLSKHQQFHCPAADCNQEKKQHSCQECGKLYTTVGALKMHIRTHTLPCKCPICGKAFSRPWLLQGHIRTHTGEKPFQCPDCPRSFADRSNLRAHQQTHVDVKKYACKICNKSFSRMSLLNKHTNSNCSIAIV